MFVIADFSRHRVVCFVLERLFQGCGVFRDRLFQPVSVTEFSLEDFCDPGWTPTTTKGRLDPQMSDGWMDGWMDGHG